MTEESVVEVECVSLSGYKETIAYLQNKLFRLINERSMVLDAGCGFHNHLISKSMVKLLIGCDIDQYSIRKNVSISMGVAGDLEAMGFRENTFDVIMSFEVIEHLDYPQAFIRTASKLLKKGGHIFLVTPNRDSIFGLAARLLPYQMKVRITMLVCGGPTLNKVHCYRLNTPTALVKTLTCSGFDNIRVTMLNRLPSFPRLRKVLFPYYQLCRLNCFSKFSTGLLCVGRKRYDRIVKTPNT